MTESSIQQQIRNQAKEPIRREVTSFTSASEQYIQWQNRQWYSGFFDRPWRGSPVRNAAKNLQRREACYVIWRSTWKIHRCLGRSTAALSVTKSSQRCLGRSTASVSVTKSSADQTTERGMRLPMDSDRSSPARSATIPSREWTLFTGICRPTGEEWTKHHRSDQRKPPRGNCHLQLDPVQSSDVPSHYHQRPTKKRAELHRFMPDSALKTIFWGTKLSLLWLMDPMDLMRTAYASSDV